MPDDQIDTPAVRAEGAYRGFVEGELHEVDGADAVLAAPALLEHARDDPPFFEPHEDAPVLVEPDEVVQHLDHARLIVHLYVERRRQLALARNQFIVDVQLLLDSLVSHEPLGTHHLLDLGADRLPVLEDEGDHRSDLDPADALQADDGLYAPVTDLLVGGDVQQVLAGELLHRRLSSSSSRP